VDCGLLAVDHFFVNDWQSTDDSQLNFVNGSQSAANGN
jgi:hypothetical protein